MEIICHGNKNHKIFKSHRKVIEINTIIKKLPKNHGNKKIVGEKTQELYILQLFKKSQINYGN